MDGIILTGQGRPEPGVGSGLTLRSPGARGWSIGMDRRGKMGSWSRPVPKFLICLCNARAPASALTRGRGARSNLFRSSAIYCFWGNDKKLRRRQNSGFGSGPGASVRPRRTFSCKES
jgi:hypothetical protein